MQLSPQTVIQPVTNPLLPPNIIRIPEPAVYIPATVSPGVPPAKPATYKPLNASEYTPKSNYMAYKQETSKPVSILWIFASAIITVTIIAVIIMIFFLILRVLIHNTNYLN